MLQGDVQISADILVLPHHSQKIPWEMCRIGIMQTNPLHALYLSHVLDQFGDMLLAVDIYTVVSQFLGNHIKLPGTLTHQIAHLIEYLIHRTALMPTRNQRDGTIGTMTVATLADLDIGIMARRGDVAMIFGILRSLRFLRGLRFLGVLQVVQQLPIVKLPLPPVDLRYLSLKVCQIAL